MGILIFLAVIVGIALLILYYVVCSEMADIAEAKGYNRQLALFACLFLSVLGFLYVIALPDTRDKGSKQTSKPIIEELPEL